MLDPEVCLISISKKICQKKLLRVQYFTVVILVPNTRQEQGELSIALIADLLKSRGQDALPSLYSRIITKNFIT